ncbi:hypothetical protein [Winogradskyella poriferorum]|uniref:Uncharacterized protein n=1 Tax=Winogradskyella poriferorum TaxID=307627 RepID=A0ABU7W2G0_9FLAO
MSTVLIIFSLTLTQIGMYLFLKSSIENVLEYYSNNNLKEKQSEAIKLQSAESIKQNDTTVLPKKVDNTNHLVLNKSLRHLEFISQFEMYLEDKNYKSFSIEFLQEFEKLKIEAQLTTLKTTNRLNDKGLRAA